MAAAGSGCSDLCRRPLHATPRQDLVPLLGGSCALRVQLDRNDYRLHDLRHTLATLLFDGGAAANDVQAIMGHSTLQMTERCSRARSDAARRGADRLDSLFGSDV
ncbi:tyrosine-type recombinase/integrase [uncultured Microbacterium sp.]|uniref:Tyr recombinase domain-containing protein n=1 Tax=uncultured Microbacterium sp. TaxID=191216 RepID=A0A1Y5P6K5_9MICO|nr:hypothetical protein MIPYR_20198 [uncultured Microbacterium sp.]